VLQCSNFFFLKKKELNKTMVTLANHQERRSCRLLLIATNMGVCVCARACVAHAYVCHAQRIRWAVSPPSTGQQRRVRPSTYQGALSVVVTCTRARVVRCVVVAPGLDGTDRRGKWRGQARRAALLLHHAACLLPSRTRHACSSIASASHRPRARDA